MSSLSVFKFDLREVRAISVDGEPWFVAQDVCEALTIGNSRDAVGRLDDDEKGVGTIDTLGGTQELSIINESGLYSLILTSRKAEAKRFKKWVTSEVLPSIRKTGAYQIAQAAPTVAALATPATEAVHLAAMIADTMRVAPSGRAMLIRQALELRAPDLVSLAPTYAIDAPTTSTSGSSEPTASATELLKKHGVAIGAAKFNKLLEQHGYLETRTRQSSSGTTKTYKAVTGKGLVYGKNITSASNPRETQPHWYVGSFGELLEVVGVKL